MGPTFWVVGAWPPCLESNQEQPVSDTDACGSGRTGRELRARGRLFGSNRSVVLPPCLESNQETIGFVDQSLQFRQDRELAAPAKGIGPSSPDRQSGRLTRCVRGQLGQPWRAAHEKADARPLGRASVLLVARVFKQQGARVRRPDGGQSKSSDSVSGGGAPGDRTPISRLKAGSSAIELEPRANTRCSRGVFRNLFRCALDKPLPIF